MAGAQEFLENPTLINGMAVVIIVLFGVLGAGAKYVTGRLERVIEKNTEAYYKSIESNNALIKSVDQLSIVIKDNTLGFGEFMREQSILNEQIKHQFK
jgi:hypothetical protein